MYSQCKVCWTEFYKENLVKIKKLYLDTRDREEVHYLDFFTKNSNKNIARERIHTNNRYKIDIIYRFIFKTRDRIQQALNGKSKSISTRRTLGIDINTYRKMFEYQFTTEMNWLNIEIDQVQPICSFHLNKTEGINEAFP